MKAIVQRVENASVMVSNKIIGEISAGILVLLGIETIDGEKESKWMRNKLINLRILPDENNVMNLSPMNTNSDILIISNFTVCADVKKGFRPSYSNAMPPEQSEIVYNDFIAKIKDESGLNIQTGKFGADMKVSLVNDGPVTLILQTND
jgi:D-aminoacyl-tRNA deacylase